MCFMLKKLERNELCILEEEKINCTVVAWALSKGLNTIYVEREGKLIGNIMLSEFIRNFASKGIPIDTELSFIESEIYENEGDKSTFFKEDTVTYLPILKNGRLEGELIKVSEEGKKEKAYWELISEDVYKERIANVASHILFTVLDERTIELYHILQRMPKVKLSIYDPMNFESQSQEKQTEKFDWVIFHREDGRYDLIEQKETKYMTIDYLYYELIQIKTLDFFKKNSIQYYYICVPNIRELSDSIKKEFYPFLINDLAKDTLWLDKYYGNNPNRLYWESGDYSKVAIIENGIGRCLKDTTSEHYNVMNGRRLTVGNPEEYMNSVHCFGPCIVRGAAVNDDSTICSYLQAQLNAKQNHWLRVLNYGVGGVSQMIHDFYNMMLANYRKHDVVIHFGPRIYTDDKIKAFDIHNIEIINLFTDENITQPSFINSAYHITHLANKLLADYIFKHLVKFYQPKKIPQIEAVKMPLPTINNGIVTSEMAQFKQELIKYRLPDYMEKKIGAIVMNCNPFTLGHLYLVEESLKVVDYLYVFIVEEDKSFFSFKERYDLAQASCKQFKNVKVIPSGKFMISTLTFPEYFFKEELKEVSINPSEDIKIFGREIAPLLNITVRMVGEEPIDKVTAQYNQFLKEELKWYNIRLIEIPRKMRGEKVISASYVRQLIKENKIEEISSLVPAATYTFLVEKFGS